MLTTKYISELFLFQIQHKGIKIPNILSPQNQCYTHIQLLLQICILGRFLYILKSVSNFIKK